MPHQVEKNVIDDSVRHGNWREELFDHGYVVLKEVISQQKCKQYMDSMFAWLEKFPLGFDCTDRATWTVKNLPAHQK